MGLLKNAGTAGPAIFLGLAGCVIFPSTQGLCWPNSPTSTAHIMRGEATYIAIYFIATRDTLVKGDHVRYAPNRVLVNTAGGLRGELQRFFGTMVHRNLLTTLVMADIYGHGSNVRKYAGYQALSSQAANTLTMSDKVQHAHRRRILSLAFSENNLRRLEPIIQSRIERFCKLIRSRVPQEPESVGDGWTSPVDMARSCKFPSRSRSLAFLCPLTRYRACITVTHLSFDLMTAVTFGAEYRTMEEASFRYVGEAIEQSNVRLGVLMQAPELTLAGLDRKLFSGAAKAGARFVKFLRKLLQKRLQQEPADGIKDIFSFLQQCKDAQTGEGLGAMEISTETATFIVAGSDTTSTTMASLAHYLVWSPRCYKRAVEEVRARFSCADEITFGAKLNSCVFLRACLDEALRITPPGGGPLWREMERGGARIDGEYLPAGCEVGAGIYAMHRSPRNWPNPDSYTPERWLDKETKSAGQPYFPFNIGPRSCVGKPLALAQIMLTFARILWEFDLCRADVGKSWLESSDAEPPEYMLQDHVTGHKEGPVLRFRPRF
ncbi:cytochrome P450 [Metarhizium robertsii]|uniref:Cytochrome P450 n=1 Tax=Metarhizium robertsii TaxID=568076 RepID=A0A014PJP5_9HYPO|nr:cytochrome P450 [Metarhizium robertsii]